MKGGPLALQPEALRFKGDLDVLTGPGTYSAAVMFAAAVKDHRLGTVAAEETGGLATQYADIYPFTLPHTKLTGVVSHKYIVRPNGADDGRGVLPDYRVGEGNGGQEGDVFLRRTRLLIGERRSSRRPSR